MTKELDLTKATYGDAKDAAYQLAVLPWGATEPHGTHLPYYTDCLLSQAIALDAAELALKLYGTRAMVLPPVFLGQQNPGQRGLKFCLHARYETQKAILADIVASLSCQGLHRLVIINGHGGNCFKNMLRDLAVDYPDMMIAAGEWFNADKPSKYFEEHLDHADEMETSAMLHYYPELIDMATAGDGAYRGFAIEGLRSSLAWMPRDWREVSADTGIGDPRKSTAEKGRRFAEVCVEAWAKFLHDFSTCNIY